MSFQLNEEVIASRLRNLRNETGISLERMPVEVMAQCNCKISRESFRNYENPYSPIGKTHPSLGMSSKNLTALAEFYNVSTDYILGRTDIKSTDTTVQDMCDYTGLSEESIVRLHELQVKRHEHMPPDNLSSILDHDLHFKMIASVTYHRSQLEHYQHEYKRQMGEEAFIRHWGEKDIDSIADDIAHKEAKQYIHSIINDRINSYELIFNAINMLITADESLHLLEEIGRCISSDPTDLLDVISKYKTRESYSSDYFGETTFLIALERKLRVIVQKIENLRELSIDRNI